MRKENKSNNDRTKIYLGIVAAIFFCLTILFGYTTLTGSQINKAKANKIVAPFSKKLTKDQQTISSLRSDNQSLQAQLNDQKQKSETKNNNSLSSQNVFLNGYGDLATKFVSQIIGPHTAADIRKNLTGIATKEVIDKVAPVDQNEKFDSKVPQSKITIDHVDSYIDKSSITDQVAKVYAIAHYKIDETNMTTRINLTMGIGDNNKLIVTDAAYDVPKTDN